MRSAVVFCFGMLLLVEGPLPFHHNTVSRSIEKTLVRV